MLPSHGKPHVCQLREVLDRVGDEWSVLVVGELRGGPRHFNELRRALGRVSQRMLTFTLRGLERDGLITRTVHPTVPPRVSYELSELGRQLVPALQALASWAHQHRDAVTRHRTEFDRRAGSAPRESASPAGSAPRSSPGITST